MKHRSSFPRVAKKNTCHRFLFESRNQCLHFSFCLYPNKPHVCYTQIITRLHCTWCLTMGRDDILPSDQHHLSNADIQVASKTPTRQAALNAPSTDRPPPQANQVTAPIPLLKPGRLRPLTHPCVKIFKKLRMSNLNIWNNKASGAVELCNAFGP
jgi:hypothetical protein